MRRRRSPQDSRDRRRRVVIWALSITLCALFVNALVGENGYLATIRAEREKVALEAELARVRIDNQQLQQQSRRLQTDPSALEEAARGELDFIKPGETLVVVRDAKPATPASPTK